jgi:glucosamine kinase
MIEQYVLGIDGGGSTIRAIVATPDLTIIGQSEAAISVNPNAMGYAAAAHTIQDKMREAVANAQLSIEQIGAVGIGIAGAEAENVGEWLHSLVIDVCPSATIALSSDHEIALVGAIGERRGILILAGTGSIAYGVNSAGKTALIGGLGYLLGDEGSGYWIGMSGLKAAFRALEGRDPSTSLIEVLLEAHHLKTRREILHWVYEQPRVRDIARFAPLVLEQAAAGDRVSSQIIQSAAFELALKVRTILHQLDREALPIAFTGSLLSHPNGLSLLLCELLDLPELPKAKYPSVMGAALLALQKL